MSWSREDSIERLAELKADIAQSTQVLIALTGLVPVTIKDSDNTQLLGKTDLSLQILRQYHRLTDLLSRQDRLEGR